MISSEVLTEELLQQAAVELATALNDSLPPPNECQHELSAGFEAKMQSLILKRKLVLEKRKLEENRSLMGGGTERAIKLIGEARQVGLIGDTEFVDYSDYKSICALLNNTVNWTPLEVKPTGMDRLSFLQTRLTQANDELADIEFNLSEAKLYCGETTGFTDEAQHQKTRLESIGLFETLDFIPGNCPLCSGKLEHALPAVDAIKKSIANLDLAISNVTKEQPKLR